MIGPDSITPDVDALHVQILLHSTQPDVKKKKRLKKECVIGPGSTVNSNSV